LSDPWFRFFPSDWISGVSNLSAAERGVYVTLLALMYDNSGPIKRDDVRLARQCGLPKAGLSRALDSLIEIGKIIHQEDGSLFNNRAENELTERENRTRNATGAAESRWGKVEQNQHAVDATALPEQCANDATRARFPQPHLKKDISDSAFEEFYKSYPKHTDKKAALARFVRMAKTVGAERLIAGARAYADYCLRSKIEPQFIKSPDVWLNKGCWDDEYPAGSSGSAAGGKTQDVVWVREGTEEWSRLEASLGSARLHARKMMRNGDYQIAVPKSEWPPNHAEAAA
jgi:uncharacterized protein YdaU (DUF1376 family)